jgi:putative ABC transport system substrate-binding protein
MPRRILGLLVTRALGVLVAPFATVAQPSAHIPHIGFLVPGTSSLALLRLEAFRQALRELGYVEGQTLTVENRWAEGQLDRLLGLAADLVRLKVDVIPTAATPAARAAMNATNTIPIVLVDPDAKRAAD